MKEEITIYEKDKIRITNARAVFGDKTYSVSNISAVELETIPPNNSAGAFLIVFGILSIIFAVPTFFSSQNALSSPNVTLLIIGLLMAAGGYFSFRNSRVSYTVKVSTSSGEVKAYTSQDKEQIDGIVEAINTAIINKG